MSKVEDILASTKVGDVLDAAKLNKFLKRQEEEEKKPSKFVIVFCRDWNRCRSCSSNLWNLSFLYTGLSG